MNNPDNLENTVRRKFLSLAAVALAALLPAAGLAQYPNKPIRFVVPFAAGSATDQIARAFTTRMQESLGQTFIVDNKPGAGSTSAPKWSPAPNRTATR